MVSTWDHNECIYSSCFRLWILSIKQYKVSWNVHRALDSRLSLLKLYKLLWDLHDYAKLCYYARYHSILKHFCTIFNFCPTLYQNLCFNTCLNGTAILIKGLLINIDFTQPVLKIMLEMVIKRFYLILMSAGFKHNYYLSMVKALFSLVAQVILYFFC